MELVRLRPPIPGLHVVAVPQLAEARIGNPEVAGSRPVRHLRCFSMTTLFPTCPPGRSPQGEPLFRPMPLLVFHLEISTKGPREVGASGGATKRGMSSLGSPDGT